MNLQGTLNPSTLNPSTLVPQTLNPSALNPKPFSSRHRGLSLEQLAALAASPAPRRGAVLQALLLHAEAEFRV